MYISSRYLIKKGFGYLELCEKTDFVYCECVKKIVTHSAQDFISMSFDAPEDGDANVRLNIGQAESVIFGGWQQQVGIPGVELDLVDGMAVAYEVLDAGLGRGAEDPDHAAGPGHGEKRISCVFLVRPGARVVVFISLRTLGIRN